MFEFGSAEFSITIGVITGVYYFKFVKKKPVRRHYVAPALRSAAANPISAKFPRVTDNDGTSIAAPMSRIAGEVMESPEHALCPSNPETVSSRLDTAKNSLDEVRKKMVRYPSVMLADLERAESAIEQIRDEFPAKNRPKPIPGGGNAVEPLPPHGRLDDNVAILYRKRLGVSEGTDAAKCSKIRDAGMKRMVDCIGELLAKCNNGITYEDFRGSYPEAKSEIESLFERCESANDQYVVECVRKIDKDLSLAADVWTYEFVLYPDSWHYPQFMEHYGKTKYFRSTTILKDRSLPVESALKVIFASAYDKYQSLSSHIE